MTEAVSALVFGTAALSLALAWLSWDAARIEVSSPSRLVAELRLAQCAALMLALAAGIYVGFAVSRPNITGSGLVIALAIGFFVIAALATTWEPGHALTALAVAWGAHGLVDLAHTVDVLPANIAPIWYPTACAIYDVCIAGLCYLPVLKR